MADSHLHWPFFDPRHRDLAMGFADWVSATLTPYEADEGGDGKTARQIFAALGRDGWLRSTALRDEPGGPLDLRSVCLLREICGRSSGIADVALSEPWLGALPVMLAGSAELKRRYLPGYLAGSLLPAFALSEPETGSDVRAITTCARRDGDHFVINGRKTWTSNCGLAGVYVVFARLGDDAGGGTMAAFAVEPGDGGLVLEERLKVMSPHTVGTWRLEDCRVPAAHLIGTVDAGDLKGASSREASMAKLHASETAHRIIDNAVQIFGGLGVTRGETVERLYRHVRAFRIFDGTSEIQQLIIARSLLAEAKGQADV